MGSPQIVSLKVDVLLCHLQCCMPQNLHEHELGPAAPDIVCSERVPYGVDCPWRWLKAQFPAEQLEIAQYDTAPELVAVMGGEQ